MKALALVEHVDRELDFIVAAKLLAARQGVELEIAHFYVDAPLLLDGPAPRIVLTPFFYAAEDAVMRDYVRAWPETAFVNLAWEQLFYPAHAKIKAPRDTAARERVTHFAWTKDYAAYLTSNGVRADRVRVTGHGVYGLLQPRYAPFFPPRTALASAHGLDPNKRWVLMPENYRWAFFTDYKLRGLARRGVPHRDLLDIRAYCQRGLAETARWCDALAARGNVEVIFRPRPATSVEEISEFIREHAGISAPRFHLIKHGSARDWGMASDVVATAQSTVLIEAALAGKRLVRIVTEPTPAAFRYEWADLAPAVRDEAAFIAACEDEAATPSAAALQDWARATFFPAGDPVEAATAAVVAEAKAAHAKSEPPRTRPKRLPAGLRDAATALQSMAERDALFRSALGSRYFFNLSTHEKDLFDAADVAARERRWAAILR